MRRYRLLDVQFQFYANAFSYVPGADPGFCVRGGADTWFRGGARRRSDITMSAYIVVGAILGGARAGCAPAWIRACVPFTRLSVNISCYLQFNVNHFDEQILGIFWWEAFGH